MEELFSCLPQRLLPWYAQCHRELPWRRDREPYHVWLSEIMLQQTRVEAVKGYYERFLHRLPTIKTLAEAPEDVLLKLWEGLGYYSRVRNLQKAAMQIVEKHKGVFPREYQEILALPGIGPYTAGAISSICFEQPTPAVDGNVLRVVMRLQACADPITEVSVQKEVARKLAAIYPKDNCGDFTQALMELGATVCVPNGAPACHCCPLAEICRGHQEGNAQNFPVKGEKKPRRKEQRTVFVLRCGEKIAVCRRPAKGLLAGMWQLPDMPGECTAQEALEQAAAWGLEPRGIEKQIHRSHIFTHVQWEMTGVFLICRKEATFFWAAPSDFEEKIGLPTAYRQFLQE